METKEVKRKLIAKIQEINNPEILEEINRLLSLDLVESDLLTLSNEQAQVISQGKKDYEMGKTKSNEDINQETETWLRNG
ncbi:hypothetical protein J0A68_08950 [Algoriphagus sp. H41]|uniref:Addiction module component n=1 Tax=Algoriphagus oliviformis TaxID=2811231 RepID=A0ABS3C2B9_9BACT|nr:hypothetical protein [Algoriphagus oliviformis]MBN7811082.1 hypothetical protein [Algoriphagus oliviformis]